MDKKQSVKNAIHKFIAKQNKSAAPRRKNKKPEKELESKLLPVLKMHGIFASVVESKAVYSAGAGRYLSGQAASGFPDIVGCNNQGAFLAIELKAPGRRSTVRPSQRQFLLNVIAHNGFAVVTDSVDHFVQLYSRWILIDSALKKSILLNDLPKEKAAKDDGQLFDD